MTVNELIVKLQRYDSDVSVIVPGLEFFNEVTVVDRASANLIDAGEFDIVKRGGRPVVLIC